jgi:hypothetical protein
MKSTPVRRRLLSGFLAAGLIAAGLSATPAHAARGPNLALGKAATTGGSTGAYPASNVNDGNAQTYWESPNNAFPQWVQVDLGGSVNIDQVVLRLPPSAAWGTRTQTLSVQGSTNGTSFSTLSASSGRVFDPATGNAVTVGFAGADARYVRVHITGNTGWPAGQLSELEVYATNPTTPEDPPPGANLAAGKPMEASSSVFTFVAANAGDDNTGTYWESNGFPATLTARLGADADLTAVVVKLNPDPIWSARTQSIQVLGRASGGSGFTSLKARADYVFQPGSGQNSVTIPVAGRVADVQLQVFGNTGAPGAQVAEFQAIGAWAPNPDLVVTGVSWSPAAPSEATDVTVSATVRNAGTAAAGATTVTISVGGTVVGSAPVGALRAAMPWRPSSTRTTRCPSRTTTTTA